MSPGEATHGADTLAARFLGPAAGGGGGGPFALLGVGHGTRDLAELRAAAARRLARIDRHPMRFSPEADELRLAIHAAVAQLADPAMHAELVRHWPTGEADHAPAAWRSHLSAVSDQMARQARLILGASGGWNTRAKKRLAHLARLHRISANDLIAALRPTAGGSSRPHAHAAATRMPEIAPPATSGRTWLLIHALLVVLLVGMASAVLRELIRPPRTHEASVASAETGTPPGSPTNQTVPAPRASILHHAALEQELANTLDLAAGDPEQGVARLGRVLQTFFARWPDMPSVARDRIVTVTARTIGTLPEAWLPAVEAGIEAGVASSDITIHAGAMAVAARLATEPALPRSVRDRYRSIAGGVEAGAGFDGAAFDVLTTAVSERTPASHPQWAAWSAALNACGAVPPGDRTLVRLRALEDQLRATRGNSGSWRSIATTLASGLTWRAGDPARAWLLAQLADESVPAARLAVLTAVLSTEVSVPGVDATMVLPENAGAADRAALATAYRAAWAAGRSSGATPGMDEALKSEVLAALAGASERARRTPRGAPDRVSVLVALARANAAAAALRAGEVIAAGEILAMPEFTPPAVAPTRSIGAYNDEWGIALLNTQSPELISRMLVSAMQDRTPFSPIAAEALVTAAQSGMSRPIRDQARALLVASARDIQILLAIDRAAARRPTTVVGDIVSAITGVELPAPRDAAWSDRVRAALLPRIAELIAVSNPTDLVYAEIELAELSARRAGMDSGAPPVPHTRSLLSEIGGLLQSNPLPADDPLAPNAILARQTARSFMAGARAQVIAVQHRALVDALAAIGVAGSVRPRSLIDRQLAEFAAEWNAATTVIDQLLASYRAEAELWPMILEGAL